MPGGGPQGTVLINDVAFADEDRSLGPKITRAANARKVIKNMHAKFVDGLTIAEAINLRNVLNVATEDNLVRPMNYHQRTEQTLMDDSS